MPRVPNANHFVSRNAGADAMRTIKFGSRVTLVALALVYGYHRLLIPRIATLSGVTSRIRSSTVRMRQIGAPAR